MNRNPQLSDIVERENRFWSDVFEKELERDKIANRDYTSAWWRLYYDEIRTSIKSHLAQYNDVRVLEAGSGSGKASILLGRDLRRTLLDISAQALNYAKYLSQKFQAQNVTYVQGDIFSLPFKDRSFDLTWNIGVVEHYASDKVILIVREMVRVTAPGGQIAVGVPNFRSLPIIKARLLRLPFLQFIPGYRIGSERRYTAEQVKTLACEAAAEERRNIQLVEIEYFGNPLLTESPRWLLYTLGRLAERAFPRRKFLILVRCLLQ